ncbi:MAG TPA: hypothetical protein PK843_11710 [bacterium]|nr:hypothetical protein [bacterium]HPN35173.1 hypothetical protein [bacterium]
MKRKKINAPYAPAVSRHKLLRLFLLLLVLLALVVIALRYYAVQRISYTPDWFEAERTAERENSSAMERTAANPIDPPDSSAFFGRPIANSSGSENSGDFIRSTRPRSAAPIPPSSIDSRPSSPALSGQETPMVRENTSLDPLPALRPATVEAYLQELESRRQVTLLESQIYPLIKETLRQNGYQPELFLKGCKTTLTENRAVLELIVDLRHAPYQSLSDEAERAWIALLKMIPEHSLSQVYLKLDLLPYRERNMIRLLPESQLSIGKINLPLNRLEKKFGLKMQINLTELQISDYRLSDHQLRLIK